MWDIREYRESDVGRLFEYWNRLGGDIPYFFPVSTRTWEKCLLHDQRDGEPMFEDLHTRVAMDGGQVVGFVQYGQPSFAWEERGERCQNPQIGVVRQLYFCEGRDEVGEALLVEADAQLARFNQTHAFYHALGMSCTAHHGKLHHSQRHVHRLLRSWGFQIEHENVYCVLDLVPPSPVEDSPLWIRTDAETDGERFEIRLGAERVGGARVRYVDKLTDGCAHDTAYLSWVGVDEAYRGRGIGAEFLKWLIGFLVAKGYCTLHVDTARENAVARRLYGKLGFQEVGWTRSYVRLGEALG